MNKELDELRDETEPNNPSTREIFAFNTRTRSGFDIYMALLVNEDAFELYTYYFDAVHDGKGWTLYHSEKFDTELELIKHLMEN